VVVQVEFCVLLAMHTAIIRHEKAGKLQCPVVSFENAASGNYDTVELNHKTMKQ
jgi:hypothetical protein